MNNTKPKYVYKYKAVNSAEDLCRILDIIKNNRIYFPTYKELNDPLEGLVVNIGYPGFAGKSILAEADVEDQILSEYREKYRILAFSSSYNNPQLWAHYADNYKGVCLCYSTDDTFSAVRAVKYCSERIEIDVDNSDQFDKVVRKGFFKKDIGWKYENEWRFLKKTERKYISYKATDFRGIILGHKMPQEIRDTIICNLVTRVPIMTTYVGYRSNLILAVKEGYAHNFDGRPVKQIDVERTLHSGSYKYIKRSFI